MTLVEAARTMLANSFLPNTFWAKAVSTSCYVLNRVLLTKPQNKTPYELLTGKIPFINYIKSFGCNVTILNTIDHLGKFKENSDEGFLVGYSLNSKAFRVYNLKTKRVEENLHIKFLENKTNVVRKGPTWLFDLDYLTDSMTYQPVTAENKANIIAGPKEANNSVGTQDNINAGNSDMEAKHVQEYFVLLLWSSYTLTVKSSKEKNKDEKLIRDTGSKTNEELVDQEDQVFLEELKRIKRQEKEADDATDTFRKTFAKSTKDLLLQAGAAIASSTNYVNTASITVNTASTIINTASTLVNAASPSRNVNAARPSYPDLSRDPTSAVQTRSKVNKSSRAHAFIEPKKISQALKDESWVNAMQEELMQFKTQQARLAAQGHRQEEGIDYDEVFAPMARIKAIEIFLAFASYMGFIVYQMDVKSAFLYGKIDQEVYVSQPLGFIDSKFPKKVYKVIKALYGLHQAPRAWYATLLTFLVESRYRRGLIHKTLFIKKDKKDIMLVKVYVDDIIFCSTKKSLCDKFEALMKSRFQISSMGRLTFFLRLQVKQKEDRIFISQDKYVAEILKKFDFMSVKTASTPIETKKPLVKDAEAVDVDVHLYRSMIGSLMYLTAFRPDIMYAVCACSRFQVTLKTSHLYAVKRIFRYLKGQTKLGLWYPRESAFDLKAYSYSDYAGANLDRKSITGVKNPVFHSKTKHIEIQNHFIRDDYEKKLIQVLKIHTDDNVADLLTNSFDVSRFNFLIVNIGMLNLELHLFRGGKINNVRVVIQQKTKGNAQFHRIVDFLSRIHPFSKELASPKQMALGKDFSNPLMVDSLPKTIWLSMHRVIAMKHWLFQSKWLMDDELEPAKLKEVVDVVTTAKLMTEVVTAATIIAATTLITAAPSAARRRKGAVIRDPEETATPSIIIHSEPKSKDKGKEIMVQDPKPLKKKTQIEQDEAYARELKIELNKNINWDDVIEKVQRKEKEDNVVLRNMAGFKMDYFKGMSYDDIRPIFEKYFNTNMDLLEKTKEQMDEEDSRALKRKTESSKEKAAKKQKLDEEATALALNVSVVDYAIYTENNKPYYKFIRVDGSHQLFLSFLSLLRNFDRKDLEVLWQIVKERFTSLKPKNFSDNFLLTTFTYVFKKPNVQAQMILLVERRYPLTRFTLDQKLNNVRLEVKEESDVSLELLRFEDLMGITTRSRNAYQGPTIPFTSSSLPKVVGRETKVTKDTVPPTNNGNTKDIQPMVVQIENLNSEPIIAPFAEPIEALVSALKPNPKPSIPYPSRLHDQKLRDKANDQKEEFIQIFQDLNFNISLTDALILMPKFCPSIKRELTLRVEKEAATFNLDQTSRYFANYNAMSVNRIDLIDRETFFFIKEFLNDNPSSPPLPPQELKVVEHTNEKASIDVPPVVELKDLPPYLEYAFLEGDDKLPVIIAKDLKDGEKTALTNFLKSHKQALAWRLSDINDSPWVSPVHCIPKKGGFTVVENEENELIPTRLVTGWRVCIDYRKFNDATRKDHFPLPFMDQMLERLTGNVYYYFLDGFSVTFKFP
uniref:Putative ribonuclease H-like domain-containing protein n=1 Tax=Tanacetum cinerariifolium TaxID=118510 RepID=A0A6L2JFN2_TANCI|nr:putative ribonuclease H-like domain-containing protein [Tanacetum cinerariifolium]